MAVSILFCTFLGMSIQTFGLCHLYRAVTQKSGKKSLNGSQPLNGFMNLTSVRKDS